MICAVMHHRQPLRSLSSRARQGWPAVAATVMPVACAAAETVGDVMEALQGGYAAGLTPLHLAVRSGSAELVRCITGGLRMSARFRTSCSALGPTAAQAVNVTG